MPAAKAHLATWSDRRFVEAFVALSGDGDARGVPAVGDTIEYGDDYTDRATATVVAVHASDDDDGGGYSVRDEESG